MHLEGGKKHLLMSEFWGWKGAFSSGFLVPFG